MTAGAADLETIGPRIAGRSIHGAGMIIRLRCCLKPASNG